MQPVPWIRLDGSINRRVLDRWLGTILTECMARNGLSARDVCKRFSYWLPVDVMFLLEILSDLKCLQLSQIHKQEFDLFSDYESIKESKYITKYIHITCFSNCIYNKLNK